MKRFLYTLPLALWLAFSSSASVITFNFEVTGGDADLVDFTATIALSAPVAVSITAVTADGVPPAIDTSSAIDSFFLDYEFFTGGGTISTDFAAFFGNPAAINDFAFSFSPSNGAGELFHNVSDVGFGAFGSSDPTGLWEIVFSSDFNFLDPPVITGRFAQVPEPGPLALILVGLAVVGFGASRRRV